MNENKRRCIWMPDALWARVRAAAALDNRRASDWLRDRAEKALRQSEKKKINRSDLDAFKVG